MNKVFSIVTVMILSVLLCTACVERPQKNTRDYTKTPVVTEDEVTVTEELSENNEEEEEEEEEVQEVQSEAVEEPETEDTHVYTVDELTDELIEEKLIGYWEFNTFGYIGGYNFFESRFLQLVLEREVNQTGVFMVRNKGVYFSLDSKSWDKDVLMIQSISNTEIRGTFGEDILVLVKADASLIKENSGITLNDSYNNSSIVDAATEVDQNVKVN